MENDRLISALYRIIEIQEKGLKRLLETQEAILKQLEHFNAYQTTSPPALKDEKRMSREETKDYLGIKETTYKRLVKEGILNPMNLGGGDCYYQRDLEEAYKESIRRGRV